MRILLISPHFYPENFKCNDVAFDLAKRGHHVTVLSDIPNYPLGRFFDGYGIFKRRKEVVNGVKIIRTFVIPRGNGSGKRLALNYLSFAVTASIRAFFMGLFHKYDAILVHETSPVTVGIPAVIVKKMQKIPLYFWVLDLWPESLQAAGGINNRKILNVFTRLTTWIYKNSRRILISSMGFQNSIIQKGDFAEKIHYFPNWPDEGFSNQTDYKLPAMPEGFKIMFAGNIGEAQDFDNIMQAALMLKEQKDIHFVLVGDGRKKPWIDDFIEKYNLQNTVHCLGRHPLTSMPLFFEKADVMLVSLKDVDIFSLTAPAKLQAYMHFSKPIVAMINGEGARIVNDANCGFTVKAGDAKGLAEIIMQMAELSQEELAALGNNGYNYCERNFNFGQNMNNLNTWLEIDTNLIK